MGQKKKKAQKRKEHNFNLIIDVFVSYGCYNKLTITNLWLKPNMYSLSQCWRPEVRNQGVMRLPLPLSGSRCESISRLFQLSVAAGILWLPWPLATSLQSASIFTAPFPQWASCVFSVCVYLIRILIIGCRMHMNKPGWSLSSQDL